MSETMKGNRGTKVLGIELTGGANLENCLLFISIVFSETGVCVHFL